MADVKDVLDPVLEDAQEDVTADALAVVPVVGDVVPVADVRPLVSHFAPPAVPDVKVEVLRTVLGRGGSIWHVLIVKVDVTDVLAVVNPHVEMDAIMLALDVPVHVPENVRVDVKEHVNQAVRLVVNQSVLILATLLALTVVEILVLAYVAKDVIQHVYQAVVEHVTPVAIICVLVDVVDLVLLTALPHVQQLVQEHHIALTDWELREDIYEDRINQYKIGKV